MILGWCLKASAAGFCNPPQCIHLRMMLAHGCKKTCNDKSPSLGLCPVWKMTKCCTFLIILAVITECVHSGIFNDLLFNVLFLAIMSACNFIILSLEISSNSEFKISIFNSIVFWCSFGFCTVRTESIYYSCWSTEVQRVNLLHLGNWSHF